MAPRPSGDRRDGRVVAGLGPDEQELADGLTQDRARVGRERVVGDEEISLAELADRGDPDDPPFRVVGEDDESAAGLDERPVGLGLEHVRAGEAGLGVHPVDAHEHLVEVDRPELADRERSDERLGRRPDAAGEDDRLVTPAGAVQDVGDADRVRDDRHARDVRDAGGEPVGRRAGRDPDRHPRLDLVGRGRRDRRLLRLLEGRLRDEPGLVRGEARERGRAAVDLLEEAVLVEDLEVAPDGHVRHAEVARELGHADGTGLADALEDEGLALTSEHRLRSAGPRPVGSFAPGRVCDPSSSRSRPKSTKSNRFRCSIVRDYLDIAVRPRDNRTVGLPRACPRVQAPRRSEHG